MRVNLHWLRDWVEFDLEPNALADKLTIAGLEVDSVLPVAGEFSGVVAAEIVSCKPHPDADRLRVCEVSNGKTTSVVVCGAPNAREGLRTAHAQVGAVLPEERQIKAASIRGVESAGMLCSAVELGLSDDAAGIIELPGDAPLGADLRDYLALDDQVLDIDLTPNRGDCFSVTGIAREIAASQGVGMPPPVVEPIAAVNDDTFAVSLDAGEGCGRFAGRVIRNIATNVASPIWLAERLRRAGLRAIHPVVDVTNYVMLELGQPLHGYDLGKLDGEIIVRRGQSGEKLTLLDAREIELDEDLVVISDRSGAIGLAGIMGGLSTAVDDDTVDVFLEAAYFSPAVISGRARRFGLHTDASMRFERGVDPLQQRRAIERATALLLEIAGGEPGPVLEEVATVGLPNVDPITLRGERLGAVLGQALPPQTVETSLELLGMDVAANGGNAWQITPPSFRFDLKIEEDLIEEVARLVGYDNIPASPEFGASQLGTASEDRVEDEAIADLLVARGYSEIISYSFIDAELGELVNPGVPPERLANPISSDLSVMRRSLWPGLLSAAAQNLSRQQERLRLFEIGPQFETGADGTAETIVVAGLACGTRWPEHWDLSSDDVDFFDVKSDVEALVELSGRHSAVRFRAAEHPVLRPGRTARVEIAGVDAGWLGELHPAAQRALDLKKTPILFALKLENLTTASLPEYRAYSKFPSLRRDLAIIVANDVEAENVVACVRDAAGANLQNVNVFDLYRGPGIDSSRKSIGLGLILQDSYRTLTDEDADRTVAAVVEHLESELGATIRN